MSVTKKRYLHHYVLTMRIFPNDEQKNIIASNMLAYKTIYNYYVSNGIFCSRVGLENLPEMLVDQQINLDDIEPTVIQNAISKYQKDWTTFLSNPALNPPGFINKESFQLTAKYPQEGDIIPTIFNSSCCLQPPKGKFLNLPKIGKVISTGSRQIVENILNMKEVLVGRVMVYQDLPKYYYTKLYLSSNCSFR